MPARGGSLAVSNALPPLLPFGDLRPLPGERESLDRGTAPPVEGMQRPGGRRMAETGKLQSP